MAEGQEENLRALMNQNKGKRGPGCWFRRCRGLVSMFKRPQVIGKLGVLWTYLSMVGIRKMQVTLAYGRVRIWPMEVMKMKVKVHAEQKVCDS